jgi:hypothetical protein
MNRRFDDRLFEGREARRLVVVYRQKGGISMSSQRRSGSPSRFERSKQNLQGFEDLIGQVVYDRSPVVTCFSGNPRPVDRVRRTPRCAACLPERVEDLAEGAGCVGGRCLDRRVGKDESVSLDRG